MRGQHAQAKHASRSCQDCAAKEGWNVLKVYRDNDVSATNGDYRPEFEQLLKDKPPAILVWSTDRLVRLSKELERVLDLGVNIYALKAGHLDLSTPAGRAVARTVAAWAQYEGEIRKERQLAAFRQWAQRGGRYWPFRPFGCNEDGTVRETEAALIRRGIRLIRGTTLGAIARSWQEVIPPQHGAEKWGGCRASEVDLPPRSRNESLGAAMRQVGVAEVRGSGWDKIAFELELHQLPPARVDVHDTQTRVTTYAPKTLSQMDKPDRILAAYSTPTSGQRRLRWQTGMHSASWSTPRRT